MLTNVIASFLQVLLGLLSVWNISFLGYPARAILPYSQALEKLASHIQQGRVILCDFIGVVKSQQPVYLKGEVVSKRNELMSNSFAQPDAQPDALAYGKVRVWDESSQYGTLIDTRGNIKIRAWEEGIFKRIWGQPKTLFL